MEEKALSETQLTALKDLVRPKLLGLIPTTPPSVDKRKDFLRANPSIPIDDSNRKLIMGILGEGLKEFEKSELDRSIALLHKERMVQDFLRSSPTVDERINFVIANSLITDKLGEQTFHLMREGLNESDQNEFISKLVMREWERVKNSKGEYFLRGSSVYSTAVKFAVNQEYKNDPISAARYSENTYECIRDFRVPMALVGLAKEIANSGDLANLIFPIISGVITDNYNKQWEEAKKSTDPTITATAEKTYRSVANASQKLKKLNNDSKKTPSDTDADDLKEYRKAVEALTSKVIEAKINEPSNTQPKTAPPTTPRSAPTTPRSDGDAQSPRKDRTKRGAMKLSAEKLETAGIKTSPRTETSHQTLAEPPVEPAARAATTRPRSPKERPPLPDFSPAPASSPDSPREKVTTGTQPTTSDSNKTPPPSPREIKIGTHRPPLPDHKAPSPPDSPRGEAKIGLHRTKSKEKITSTDSSINTKEQESSATELLEKTDELRTRVDQLNARAVKLKGVVEKSSERMQDLKLTVDRSIEHKLDRDISRLEIEKEKLTVLREKLAKRRADLSQKINVELNPQAKDMLRNSKVQLEKAEKAKDEKENNSVNTKISPRGSHQD